MKKNICKAMVLMSVALMSISPVMAESNDDVMVISENSQSKEVDDDIVIGIDVYKRQATIFLLFHCYQ